ncbi:hypothetical protein [Arthrobacter flavus]|uniref:Uncharacterized protein n=1 Tax=Arthrobacter flavus TaxID=95172 RepID=A0ABW4Q6J4_9MICC
MSRFLTNLGFGFERTPLGIPDAHHSATTVSGTVSTTTTTSPAPGMPDLSLVEGSVGLAPSGNKRTSR